MFGRLGGIFQSGGRFIQSGNGFHRKTYQRFIYNNSTPTQSNMWKITSGITLVTTGAITIFALESQSRPTQAECGMPQDPNSISSEECSGDVCVRPVKVITVDQPRSQSPDANDLVLATTDKERRKKALKLISTWKEVSGSPGVVVSVLKEGKVVFSEGVGLAG